MTFEVTMPQMGADMTEGTLIRWLKEVGDHVERGDILAEIETDKATVELEAFESGELLRQIAAEGEAVPVGEVIALLGDKSESIPGVQPEAVAPAPTPSRRAVAQPTDGVVAPAASPAESLQTVAPKHGVTSDARVRISPVARRIANQAGIDVAALAGSGPDGRILRRDVEGAIAGGVKPPATVPAVAASTAPAATAADPHAVAAPLVAGAPAPSARPAAGMVEPLSKMRQAIARRMALSKQTQPHYYLTLDIDMTAAMAFRTQLNASANEEQRVSVNDLIVKACAIALERHPKFNAAFSEAGLVKHDRINIDIGIAMDEGLIAPALLDCASKSLGRIAIESKDLVNRAKTGHLSASEYSDGTFTITNLGAYGVETLIGIINPPQAGILGVGSVMPQPVVRDGQVVVGQVMKVALSADHRVSDGAEGARFIKEIQGLLENPVALAL